MVRNPYALVISNWIYHAPYPTPESWVKKVDPCTPESWYERESLGDVVESTLMSSSVWNDGPILQHGDNIPSMHQLCTSFYQSNPTTDKWNFYTHMTFGT